MLNTFITHLQLFGIGFSFGIAGPCLLSCTPVIITYVTGVEKKWGKRVQGILTFSFGRLLAYVLLGYLAALSGLALRQFTAGNLALFFKPLAGATSILLGVLVLVRKAPSACACKPAASRVYDFGGMFIFGFLIGMTPCAPLLALLFEIALISGTPLDGACYALSFGMGTLISGLIVMGSLVGILAGLSGKILKSGTSRFVFKAACASLLILLGIGFII